MNNRTVYIITIRDELYNFLKYHNMLRYINYYDKKGFYNELKDLLEAYLNQYVNAGLSGHLSYMTFELNSYIDYIVDVTSMPDYLTYEEITDFLYIIERITDCIIESIGAVRAKQSHSLLVSDIKKNYVVIESIPKLVS